MPKSVSTLQNQISGCERSMQEAFNQCAVLTGDNNFTFQFSLNVFVKGITAADLDETVEGDRGAGARENRGREGYGRREKKGREAGSL